MQFHTSQPNICNAGTLHNAKTQVSLNILISVSSQPFVLYTTQYIHGSFSKKLNVKTCARERKWKHSKSTKELSKPSSFCHHQKF